jgi:CO dehydrogenase/acetyl-CoA synthase alpha subunit
MNEESIQRWMNIRCCYEPQDVKRGRKKKIQRWIDELMNWNELMNLWTEMNEKKKTKRKQRNQEELNKFNQNEVMNLMR